MIYHIVNDEGSKFKVNKVIDFSHHDMRRELFKFRDDDWVSVHITDQALMIAGKVYSLNTDLQYKAKLPDTYFGDSS